MSLLLLAFVYVVVVLALSAYGLHAGVLLLLNFRRARARLADRYTELLKSVPGAVPIRVPEGAICNFYKYIVMLELDPGIDRVRLKQVLKERYQVNLSGEVYETPLHLQPIFKEYGAGPLPVAEEIGVGA